MRKLNKKGFTLAELLIVVAIIAVLVAISIPVFSEKLESAREATDLSNLRAAYAVAQTDVLTGEYKNTTYYTASGTGPVVYTGYYDVEGKMVTAESDTTKVGKGTATKTGTDLSQKPTQITYATETAAKGKSIVVTITETDGVAALTSVAFAS